MKTEFNSSAKSAKNIPLVVAIIFVVFIAIMAFIKKGSEGILSVLLELMSWFPSAAICVLVTYLVTRMDNKDNKQIEITESGLTFFYEKREERHRFDEYDGYMKVHVEASSPKFETMKTYLYLVKDHKRIDVINLEIYENRSAFRSELDKHLKYLGKKDISILTHWDGGGKLEY